MDDRHKKAVVRVGEPHRTGRTLKVLGVAVREGDVRVAAHAPTRSVGRVARAVVGKRPLRAVRRAIARRKEVPHDRLHREEAGPTLDGGAEERLDEGALPRGEG